MELELTPEQVEYLKDKPINAEQLKEIYRKSVEDQQETLRKAEDIKSE